MRKNLKTNLKEANQITFNQELGENERNVNQLSDGSLVIAESSDSEDTTENTNGMVNTLSAKKVIVANHT